MRFWFVSPTADGVGIASRLIQEGHEVSFWCMEHDACHVGEGFVPFFGEDEFRPSHGDTVIFDMSGQGKLADTLRWSGFTVLGSSSIADRLEKDRDFAFEVMQDCGIRFPEYYSFHDWESGKAFAKSLETKVAFKPSGDIADECSSTVLEPDELYDFLDKCSGQFPKDSQYEVQEFIEGVDLSTEGWFNGTHFLEPFNHTLETKKFMDGDKGPSEGCTGNVVWAATADDPVVQETILRMEPFLAKHHYVGPLDINVILSADGPYALEFTPRFGYDATPTLFYELLDCGVGDFLAGVARGSGVECPLREGFAAGLRVSIPPWPNQKYEAESGIAIEGLRGSDSEHFCPMNVMVKEGQLRTAGAWGIVGIATGYGRNIEESFEAPYKIANRLSLPQKQYRTDLTEYFKKRFRKVHSEVTA